MKKPYRNIYLLFIVLLLTLGISGSAYAGRVLLPDSLEVKIKFDSTLQITSGKLVKGAPIAIHLAEPIQIGGVTIVERGAPGTAVVSEVKKAGKGGKPGQIKVDFTELEPKGDYMTEDSAKIKLLGSVENKGKKKGIFPYLFFILLVKGGEGQIKADSVYTATTAESIMMSND
jgi:hypothetical protein